MATNTVGIDKEVEVNRKENLRDHRLYWIGRRTQDVILSSLALVVLSPVMLATAIAIVVDDPSAGPVFSQERIGRNGKPFKFYKFRSMCPNAEAKLDDLLDQNEMDGPVFKIKDDPRITRVGKFIRKTSLDELPQLWNILKGDMSIVGPRPALPREVEQYGDYEKQRLYVTPGLSCYWQIAPLRNDLSFEEWMDLDVKYVDPTDIHRIPAQISPENYARAQELACAAHKALGCLGISRSDFIVSEDGPVILETNTIPGMTDTSLYPDEIRHTDDMTFPQVCDSLIRMGLRRAGIACLSRTRFWQERRSLSSTPMPRLPSAPKHSPSALLRKM